MVTVIGIPSDENSSFMRGSALAPPKIREALHSPSTNLCSEFGIDFSQESRFIDFGDIEFASGVSSYTQIEEVVTSLLTHDVHVLSIGGDHSITYPVFKAYSDKYANLNILHFDAHPDLYHNFEENRYSHASPFARIMEDQLAGRLVQLGIRTMNSHQRVQAEHFGVETIEMKNWQSQMKIDISGPMYLSLDLDALDPAFAPGVSHHEPGGFSTREVLNIIQNLDGPIVGADIVEYNPKRDINGVTAMVAAKFVKEIATIMLK